MRQRFQLALLVALAACAGGSATEPSAALLAGRVLRSPIRPVCIPTEPCEAPFSATFDVFRGGWPITQFRSDAEGRFAVWLAPGPYTIQPGPDAPIIAPQEQSRQVVVEPQAVTTVELHFDTGLR